jgi:ubiquinone/menaquinone biosynthesis C-methylase UbiE
MHFKDYFSATADEYARRRPHYPASLFAYLASLADAHELAWDCATGNGQAAVGLAPYFTKVIATDASDGQLKNAFQHPKLTYRQARAEASGLEGTSIDLVTVAQAVHWFDVDAFFAETRRVLKPDGVCAVWCYTLTRISPEIDALVDDFYFNVVSPYWPREFAIVNDGYRSLSFPFGEVEPPEFSIEQYWTLDDLFAYIGTWSPVRRFMEANDYDPIEFIREATAQAWGDPSKQRLVYWPIKMRVGRNK